MGHNPHDQTLRYERAVKFVLAIPGNLNLR
jgi:hypothetical protein